MNEWNWMMSYCKENGLAPANELHWRKAREALMEYFKTITNQDDSGKGCKDEL
jgi:hypothetical protein